MNFACSPRVNQKRRGRRRRHSLPETAFVTAQLRGNTILGFAVLSRGEGARKTEILLGFREIRADAKSLVVMGDGRVDFSGVLAQAPGSDTVGWFARDAGIFGRVCEAVFGAPPPDVLPRRLIVATDAFAFADPAVAAALAPMVERLASLIGTRQDRVLAPQGLSVWQAAQRCLQSSEAWQTFRPWIDAHNPRFAFAVARNLTLASQITDNERMRAVWELSLELHRLAHPDQPHEPRLSRSAAVITRR